MKRLPQDSKFDLMRMLDRFTRANGLNVRDPTSSDSLIEALKGQLHTNLNNDTLFHGLRVQSMFAYVTVALGGCRLVKEEDAGELYTDEDSARPDFRVLTSADRQLLIEVKNCHTANPGRGCRLSRPALERLQRYASAFQVELLVAVFWSRLRVWTLVGANDFTVEDGKCVISFEQAMKRNQMHVLGDCMVGTKPPLTLKLFTDPTKARTVGPCGKTVFTIARADLYCGDSLIEDETEKRLAWFFMNYGTWHVCDTLADVAESELVGISLRVASEERDNPCQQFEILGCLSTMISLEFNATTVNDGTLSLLSPRREPDTFGVLIPRGYKGKALPLWRFTIEPA